MVDSVVFNCWLSFVKLFDIDCKTQIYFHEQKIERWRIRSMFAHVNVFCCKAKHAQEPTNVKNVFLIWILFDFRWNGYAQFLVMENAKRDAFLIINFANFVSTSSRPNNRYIRSPVAFGLFTFDLYFHTRIKTGRRGQAGQSTLFVIG